MSFDPFEARLHFLQLIRKLNASQASIQKVVAYAIKYGSRCGEDLWECVTEECGKGSLNTRINILYFLDSLAEACLPLRPEDAPYLAFLARDLEMIVSSVVPKGEGVLNMKATKQILDSWRLRRLLDVNVVEAALKQLEDRRPEIASPRKRSQAEVFSRSDILRRMEEDRERHKRLRERIWILPIPPLRPPAALSSASRLHALGPTASGSGPSPSSSSPFTPASPSSRPSAPRGSMAPPPVPVPTSGSEKEKDESVPRSAPIAAESALHLEFEQTWDAIEPLDEEDLRRMRQDKEIAARSNGAVAVAP